MKRLSLYLLILSGTYTLPTNAMFNAQRLSNGFRMCMKGLNTAAFLGLSAILYSNDQAKKKLDTEMLKSNKQNSKNLEKTEKFVLNTLHSLYPELKNRNIKVILTTKSPFFATYHRGGIDYIDVPFDDEMLNQAKYLAEFDTLDGDLSTLELIAKEDVIVYEKYAKNIGFSKNYNIEDVKNAIQTWANMENCSIEKVIAVDEITGLVILPRTLKTWQGILAHEGSHILHNDNQRYLNFILTPLALLLGEFALLKATEKCNVGSTFSQTTKNILNGLSHISSFAIKSLIYTKLLSKMPHPINYWMEYRADKDAANRIKDPEILEALSAHNIALADESHANKFKIDQCIKNALDPHPANAIRAKRFAEAAQKLRNEQLKPTQIKS